MTNLKELAEILLRAHNSEEGFNSIVDQMNSSSNTVKEDVDKLRKGAKVEVTFDIDRMYELAEIVEGDIQSARDAASTAEDYASEACGAADEADSGISKLLAMIETATEELKRVIPITPTVTKGAEDEENE